MKPPPLPDWLLYLSAVGLVLFVAENRQEKINSPAPPPPPPGEDGLPLEDGLSFSPGGIRKVPAWTVRGTGAAFSVADKGVWLTARSVVEDCGRTVLMVGGKRGVAAAVRFVPDSRLALLTTTGGAPSLIQAASSRPLKAGDRAYIPGYPQGQAGEVSSRYLGQTALPTHRRGEKPLPGLAWADTGRTDELRGSLAGLAGAPVLDSNSQVVGVILSEAPRRGRLYSASRAGVDRALAAAGIHPAPFTGGEPVNGENYGRIADTLRRDMRVAKVACLSH